MENKKLELVNGMIKDIESKEFYLSRSSITMDSIYENLQELKEILLEEDTYKNASENMEV